MDEEIKPNSCSKIVYKMSCMSFIVQKWIIWKSNLSKNTIVKNVSIIDHNYIDVDYMKVKRQKKPYLVLNNLLSENWNNSYD